MLSVDLSRFMNDEDELLFLELDDDEEEEEREEEG